MKEMRTEITINRSPSDVWKVFSNTKDYPNWSSFIEKIQGTMNEGDKLDIHLKTPKGQTMDIKPQVLVNEPLKEFRWLGKFAGVNFLFTGEHYFKLEPVDENRTRFIQGEKFTGILIPLVWKSLDSDTRSGFNEFNNALKKKVEGKKMIQL
jgi:hypothetical protein